MDAFKTADSYLLAAIRAFDSTATERPIYERDTLWELYSLTRILPELPAVRHLWVSRARGLNNSLTKQVNDCEKSPELRDRCATLLYVQHHLHLAVSLVGSWGGREPVPEAATNQGGDIGGQKSDV